MDSNQVDAQKVVDELLEQLKVCYLELAILKAQAKQAASGNPGNIGQTEPTT